MSEVWKMRKGDLVREIPTLGEANQLLAEGWKIVISPKTEEDPKGKDKGKP